MCVRFVHMQKFSCYDQWYTLIHAFYSEDAAYAVKKMHTVPEVAGLFLTVALLSHCD